MQSMRRVVVTGMGLLSPFGVGVEHAAGANCLAGESAARRIDTFEVDDLACEDRHVIPAMAGKTPSIPRRYLEPKDLRKIGDFIIYGVAAADDGA
jgi:3-oxoacyl-[acyl-carrier-protein] synthase II